VKNIIDINACPLGKLYPDTGIKELIGRGL